ncbi:hypothetical protein FQZ97_766070 [compost metagenome]
MIYHDGSLHLNGLRRGLDKGLELLLSLGAVEQRIVLDGLGQFVVALVGGVVAQHIENKTLLDGLFHRIEVAGIELAVSALPAEFLQRCRFWSGGEGEVAGVLAHFAAFHGRKDLVLQVFRLLVPLLGAQGGVELVGGRAGL